MVVSSRAVQEDVEFLDLAGKSDRLRYLRHDASFARTLARGFPKSAATLKIYSGPNRKIERVASDERSIVQTLATVRSEIESRSPSDLPMAAFAGVLLAFLIPAGAMLFRVALLTAAAASLWQVLHQCPTCPVTTILGIPAGALGV